MWAMKIHARALSMVASKAFAGPDHLMIWKVQWPKAALALRSLSLAHPPSAKTWRSQK
jgi:hypothetical protein